MLNVKLEGFEEFAKILESHQKADIGNIEVVIYNDHEAALTLEYGSDPGQKPWPNPGKRTFLASDIFSHDTKIVSIRGYGMLRGNEAKVKEYLQKELSKINLLQDIRDQVVKILKNSAEYWIDEAKIDSVGDLIDSNWDIKVYV